MYRYLYDPVTRTVFWRDVGGLRQPLQQHLDGIQQRWQTSSGPEHCHECHGRFHSDHHRQLGRSYQRDDHCRKLYHLLERRKDPLDPILIREHFKAIH